MRLPQPGQPPFSPICFLAFWLYWSCSMLGEMAVANPDTGSVSTYADQAIGRWAGFTIGWLYRWFWVLVIPIEALAAGHVLNNWFPQVDAWLFVLIFVVRLARRQSPSPPPSPMTLPTTLPKRPAWLSGVSAFSICCRSSWSFRWCRGVVRCWRQWALTSVRWN